MDVVLASPDLVDLVLDKLVEINRASASVLLVEQNARCALDICHGPKDEG